MHIDSLAVGGNILFYLEFFWFSFVGHAKEQGKYQKDICGYFAPYGKIQQKEHQKQGSCFRQTFPAGQRYLYEVGHESNQAENAKIKYKSKVADVCVLLITMPSYSCVIWLVIVWILEVTIAYNPCLDFIRKNDHVFQDLI